MKTIYRCTFYNAEILKRMTVDVPTIGDIMNGFWLNEHLEFTKLSDNKIWIAPSQIFCVVKIVVQ